MHYAVYLSIQPDTLQQFQQVSQKINIGTTQRQAKILGEILADLACHVMDQVFAEIVRQSKQFPHNIDKARAEQSAQVIDKIIAYIRQYMPYAIALLSNERLKPLVNYLDGCIKVRNGQHYLTYPIDDILAAQQVASFEQIQADNDQAVHAAFTHLVNIIDAGVDALLLQPKNILKFNVIINKTLDGVIHMCTHLGYQRLEKVTADLTAQQAKGYLDHFFAFLYQQSTEQLAYK